tara:strand:- start:11808 stop:12200 length:393 start_codon:yes stop_codon:yes gene_type:complete
MFAFNIQTNQYFTGYSTLVSDMTKLTKGDLVCFDGDEEDLLLGVGLVMQTKGDVEDLEYFEDSIRDFYDEEEYWKISHILPDAPMVLVLWSRSAPQEESDFDLYNMEKLGYSFMWVYPTEVKVISRSKKD